MSLGRGDLDRLKLIFKTSLAVQFVLAILVIIIAETVGLWFLHTKVVIPYERFEAGSLGLSFFYIDMYYFHNKRSL